MAGCRHVGVHFGVRFVGGEMMRRRFDVQVFLAWFMVGMLLAIAVLLVVALVREVLA